MAQALFSEGLTDKPATFSAHFRNLPSGRNFLLACGVDTILEHFENLSFSDDAVSYLDSTRLFTDSFLDWIKGFQFTCNVRAIAEGTPVFPDEPLLEVNGPIIEAQIVETFVLNQIHLQTILASKAARSVSAAGGLWPLDRKFEAEMVEDATCPHCEQEKQDEPHLIWSCPKLKESTNVAILKTNYLTTRALNSMG